MEKSVSDWGAGNPMAPSRKKIQPTSWLMTSAVGGALTFAGVMALMWRDLPALPVPAGDFSTHLGYAIKSLWHCAWPQAYEREAATFAAHIKQFTAVHGTGPLATRLFVASFASLAPAVFSYKSFMFPQDGLLHVRGAQRFTGKDAAKRLKRKLGRDVKLAPDHELAPGIAYPVSMWTRHVLVVGGVGSGKSTFLRPLIERVIAADEKALIFDPKGEFTAAHTEPVLLAPWDARSYAWDIAADLRNKGDMRRFATSIIKEGTDPMWANAARQILVGFLCFLQATYGALWSWKDLRDMLALPQEEVAPIMARFNPEALRAVERASVTTTGILINLAAFCATIFDLATAWADVPPDRRVSFVRWVKDPSYQKQVILQGHGAYPEITKGFTEGVIGVIAALVNSVEVEDSRTAKFWLIADEFPQLGNVPVRALFEVGRSRGVRCVIACQDLAQVESVYGKEQVKALTAMCGTLIIGQIGAGETAESLAKVLGSREVERENVSASFNAGSTTGGKSTTITYNRDELAIYKPSELMSRLGPSITPGGVVMCVALGGDAYELYWPFVDMPKKRAASVPATWTKGIGPGHVFMPKPLPTQKVGASTTKAVLQEAPDADDLLHEDSVASLAPDELGEALLEELGVVAAAPDASHHDIEDEDELEALFDSVHHSVHPDPIVGVLEHAMHAAEQLDRKPGPAPQISVQPKGPTHKPKH